MIHLLLTSVPNTTTIRDTRRMNAIDSRLSHSGAPGGRKRIAVIGSGISGLSAAWLLGEAHDVTLYESESWIGGHSNTVDVAGPGGPIAVDTGFIVFNEPNYPNLTALLRHLAVETQSTSMSFAASIDSGAFEYSSSDLNRLLGQRRNIVRPRFWRMVRDIMRFYAEARAMAAGDLTPRLTVGEYLAERRFSSALRDDHVIPMCAAIWSTAPGEILDMPLAAFVRFFSNHGLLDIGKRPNWRTIVGGSRTYVSRLVRSERFRLRTGGALKVIRTPMGPHVADAAGQIVPYDEVVIATHADTALDLLDRPSADESEVLGAFRYTTNTAVLHRDPSLMPQRRRVWSSWNFAGTSSAAGDAPLTVTYWMNNLQHLDPRMDLFVTLNPARPIPESRVEATFTYAHPVLDRPALDAQGRLWDLQGQGGTWFCGAYFGYGFHEDGLQSGLAVAEAIGGVRRPWTLDRPDDRIAGPASASEAAA